MRLLALIPTYNEIENIEGFIKAVFAHIPTEAEILVVDDNSPDGTARAVEKLFADYPGRLHILNRPEKQGLAGAYLAGFSWGLARGYEALLEIDADFSHDPRYIPAMLEQILIHDAVIGSRNIPGGGVEGFSFSRNVISKGGSLYARLVLGCPVRDLTGGFNMWRRTALEKMDLSSIVSQGFSFQIEMKYRAYRAGCSIVEIPILFTDRKKGASKMSKRIFFEALIKVWEMRSGKLAEFFKFAITGGMGTATNLVIFFLCADLLGLYEIPVSIGCFVIAVTQNYFINHRWSFKKTTAHTKPSPKQWALFIAASLAGLAVNLVVMRTVLIYWTPSYKVIAQAAGIAAGLLVNFGFSKHVVFRSTGGDQ